MNVVKRGIKITEICDQVPVIETDSQGAVRIYFRPNDARIMEQTGYMSLDDLREVQAAIAIVLMHFVEDESKTDDEVADEEPHTVTDGEGEVWIKSESHDGRYILSRVDHNNCNNADCIVGMTLEYIREYYGLAGDAS